MKYNGRARPKSEIAFHIGSTLFQERRSTMPEKRSKFIRAAARLLTTAMIMSVQLQYVILSMTENEVELVPINSSFCTKFLLLIGDPSLAITDI